MSPHNIQSTVKHCLNAYKPGFSDACWQGAPAPTYFSKNIPADYRYFWQVIAGFFQPRDLLNPYAYGAQGRQGRQKNGSCAWNTHMWRGWPSNWLCRREARWLNLATYKKNIGKLIICMSVSFAWHARMLACLCSTSRLVCNQTLSKHCQSTTTVICACTSERV